jgi:hypothetical protein
LLAISLIPTSPKIKRGKLLEFSITDLHRRSKVMDLRSAGSTRANTASMTEMVSERSFRRAALKASRAICAHGERELGSGGTAWGTNVKNGGLEILFSGSVLGSETSATTVSIGGTFQAIGLDVPINLLAGGTGEIGSGALTSALKVLALEAQHGAQRRAVVAVEHVAGSTGDRQ